MSEVVVVVVTMPESQPEEQKFPNYIYPGVNSIDLVGSRTRNNVHY